MPSLSHRVHFVTGLFFSISVSAAVLACALWNFQQHETHESIVYGVGVLSAFILNMIILISLVYGTTRHVPILMTPYIVCSTMHGVISVIASVYFLICTVHGIVLGTDLVEVYGFVTFIGLSYFWLWSAGVIREEKKTVTKLAGKHVPFINDEYI